MFAKQFKTKSYNPLKGSARKGLVQKIQAVYPGLTEDDLKELVPLKAGLSIMKLTTSADEDVTLHIVDNVPIIIDIRDVIYPTTFALWRCPNMLPTVTIHDTVAKMFTSGCYNVTRGHIYFPPRGVKLPVFKKGQVVCVNMTDNKAAVLVGLANYSSGDLLLVERGQCVKTIQMIGDLMCRYEKFGKVERPNLGIPYEEPKAPQDTLDLAENLAKIDLKSDEAEAERKEEKVEENTSEAVNSNEEKDKSDADENGFPSDMDALLKYCLLSVLKTEGKKIVLPLKTNLLYANHMTPFCPPESTLDVKKSSYKKMGKFLEAIQQEGILQVKPIEKGVDAVVSVDFNHPSIREHKIVAVSSGGDSSNKDGATFTSPCVKDMYKVTSAVLPFFEPMGFKRGQAVTGAQASNCIVAYVRRNNLQHPEHTNMVKSDPIIAHTTPHDTMQTFEDLKANILKKMTHCTEMTFADGSSTINTGKLPMITMQVANRSGNKKVTIVSNLHYYGISLTAMSKECQHGVAASCTITKNPGSKFDQLLVQGNQTYFLAKHLTEFYGLPKRFIEGADKALAKKK